LGNSVRNTLETSQSNVHIKLSSYFHQKESAADTNKALTEILKSGKMQVSKYFNH